jgi:crotonobetainyl-CoA:carnitine CoA-transferase CaiB-like acyl-CoA transferase
MSYGLHESITWPGDLAGAADAEHLAFLGGVRVLEVGDELGEYCGKVLAGLGADVVRVEPPGGAQTRTYGPFLDDEPHPDRSLHFWHHNLGKRSVVLDLDCEEGQASFRRLAVEADVILDSRPRGYLAERGLDLEDLHEANPGLVHARISPFGDVGPWRDYVGTDLVHLALGGVMMNCGYDPDPTLGYDTPPIAPQMWQAYCIAGEMAAMSIVAALIHRLHTGQGQALSTSVHQAVSQNTETDLPDWIFLKQVHRRVTCRHSTTSARSPSIALTKDGRYVLPYRTYVRSQGDEWDATVALLRMYRCEADLGDAKYDTELRHTDEARDRLAHQVNLLLGQTLYARDVWRDAQALGLPWTPVRRPEENAADEHWLQRGAFFEVEHPELDRTFLYTGGKWVTEELEWPRGPRPPLVGEHTDEVEAEWRRHRVDHVPAYPSPRAAEPVLSPHGKPFALSGVRVIDMSWMLASAGAGRFLAAMGADVVKVEHISRPDRMRFSPLGACPSGGRAARSAAVDALPTPPYTGDDGSPNRSGSFMEINAGKRSLSLNLKHAESRTILEDLIRDADMVVEGFSPGTMTRMGLGYERLRELNPRIIYVQQSGLGERGSYGSVRTFGPSAQAISGISDMSGLPAPFPPAGIGYSYLDWFGAYNMATAMLAALYRRDVTGRGCHIDASQGETGLYLTGTAILDKTANGRDWARYGNRSPYKPAAPHGAFPTRGEDRWLAIAAFTDTEWYAVTEVLDLHELRDDQRFTRLEDRLRHHDELERLLAEATRHHDGFELMHQLQARGVPAGVCQTAEDRVETDPQLAALGWLVELEQSELGRWPVKEHPTWFSETPTYIGGRYDRSGPSYGEDTDRVLAELAGLDADRIAALRADGAL